MRSGRRQRPSGLFSVVTVALIFVLAPALAHAQTDTAPPVLASLSYTPASIDTTSAAATVTVTVRITDNLSGVNGGCLAFRSPSGSQAWGACFSSANRISGSALDGIYEAAITFPRFSEAGTWHITDSSAYVYDVIGNTKFYSEAELATAGFSTTLSITSVQDTTPPSVVALAYSPGTVDVSGSAQSISVTVRMTDDLSGVNGGCLAFRSPSGSQAWGTCFSSANRISGTALDGVYQSTIVIPRYAEPGTWHITDSSVYVYDVIGNTRFYTEASLTTAGFSTTLSVQSSPADTTAPTVVGLEYVPAAVNTTGGPQSVTMTVRFTDDLSGVNGGCVAFRSPSGSQAWGTCFSSANRIWGDELDGIYRSVITLPQFSELGTWHITDSSLYVYDVIGNTRFYTEAALATAGMPTTLLVTTNLPPIANAGPDGSAEVGAGVTLTGSGFDPDGPGVTYEWLDDAGTRLATSAAITVIAELGPKTYTLRVTDSVGLIGLDTAVATGVDTTPPSVTVVAPNGGEKLFAASPYLIRWTAADVSPLASFNVLFSANGGASYASIAECTGLPGTTRACTWAAPGTATTAGRIRVVATDASANTGSDVSNLNFTIVSGKASVSVTAPNVAGDLGIGAALKITWTHTLGANAYMRIDVSRDGRETWEPVVASVKNTSATAGSYTWDVTGPLTPTARFRVGGTDVLVSDISDADVTISPPYITVAQPSATKHDFGYGTTRTAAWVSNLGAIERVDVALSVDGGSTCGIALGGSVLASSKSLTFATPVLGAPAGAARLCVLWPGQGVVGMSPVDFRVTPPYVKVTYPNVASDKWTVGSTQTITWADNLGPAEKVRIELSTDGGATYPIVLASTTPADGLHQVVVQAGWATPGAKIRLTWVATGSVTGASSQSFRIQ